MENIGVYIHIPFCLSRCYYCDFVSSLTDDKKIERYVDALVDEIKLVAAQIKYHYVVDTIYIGGGTPSVLTPKQLGHIVFNLKKYLRCDVKEFTIEANPCSLDIAKITAYRRLGITRVSIGVQTFNPTIAANIGRIHTSEQAKQAIEWVVNSGLDCSVDAMLGLPGQSRGDIDDFVDEIALSGVGHVSAYMLKLEEGTTMYNAVNQGKMQLPDEDATCDMYDRIRDRLQSNGFHRYEVSNFCKEGKESKHNLKYWQCLPYIGLGLGAHSLVGNKRFYNPSDFAEYYAAVDNGKLAHRLEQKLSEKDMMDERIMLGLRMDKGMDIDRFNADFNINFLDTYRQKLKKVQDYVKIQDRFLSIRSEYMGVMNGIISELIFDD
ncbi:MAG: radical SAM family heme chaperone HemW [Christensenellales bacterium]